MKISLITYHVSSNYGAVMQTYSLCKYLKDLGHEVELIDARQVEETIGVLPRIIKPVVFFFRMRRIFKRLYPSLSKRYKSIDELRQDPPKSDVYMVGSDQVWNPNISKDLKMAYFLDFGTAEVNRVSYASSFGISIWPTHEDIESVSECLQRFNSISVREEEGKQLCKKVFGLTPEVVADPTFLLDNYDELVPEVRLRNEIVCYKLKKDKDFFDNIGKIGKKVGIPIALLNHNYKVKGLRYCFPPSLKQWLNRLASAKFIITDSFHGIAFSILFNKQFVVIKKNDGKDSRLINILRCTGLENRMYESMKDLLEDETWLKNKIDYKQVNIIVKTLRNKSRNYLKEALSRKMNVK